MSSSSHPGLTEPLTRRPNFPPLDLSHHFSETTKRRVPSSMKAYYKYFMIPGIGQLAGGLPNPQFFPFDTLEAQSAIPTRFKPTPNHPEPDWESEDFDNHQDPSSSSCTTATTTTQQHLLIPSHSNSQTRDPTRRIDLASALQYGTAQGYPPLLNFLHTFTRTRLHPNVPYANGPDIILTCGSTDGFAKCLELLVDPYILGRDDISQREGMLVEKFCYPNVLSQFQPKGVQAVPVEIDTEGMLAAGPGGLDDVLSNWDVERDGGRRPRLMYTVTMGHNPTSGVLGVKRRKEIYEICDRWDVVIIEDDPYWYLQYPSAEAEEAKSRGRSAEEDEGEDEFGASAGTGGKGDRAEQPSSNSNGEGPVGGGKSSGSEFLDSLTPSYLSIDVSGRVIRLDTFSKTVAPGCRLGWITAQPSFIARLLRITESTTQQPSGFVQSMVASLILGTDSSNPPTTSGSKGDDTPDDAFQPWQADGFIRWLSGLRGTYERRMRRMSLILDQGSILLKQSTPLSPLDRDYGVISTSRLLSFPWPRGGMFIWLRIHLETHPLFHAARSPAHIATIPQLQKTYSKNTYNTVLTGTDLNMALTLYLTKKPHLVLVSPGMMFAATDAVRAEEGWKYYRLCFAAESEENVDACSHRFVSGLHRFWKIRKVEEIEEIIKHVEGMGVEEALPYLGMGRSDRGVVVGNLGWIGQC